MDIIIDGNPAALTLERYRRVGRCRHGENQWHTGCADVNRCASDVVITNDIINATPAALTLSGMTGNSHAANHNQRHPATLTLSGQVGGIAGHQH